MLKSLLSSLSILCLASLSLLISNEKINSQNHTLPNSDLRRVKTYFESKSSARYMEQNCVSTSYPGWDNLPLKECTYSVKGSQDVSAKKAKVIMLNPSPEQLARWVVYTCLEVTGTATANCTNKLSERIIDQSGAQFPVAGIVFEDIIPQDGIYEAYAFRNGITVKIEGVTHRGTKNPSDEEIQNSINGKVTKVFQYARLQGTTPHEYKLNGGKENIGDIDNPTSKWLEVSRDLYKSAWGKDRNELMIAWARVNFGKLDKMAMK